MEKMTGLHHLLVCSLLLCTFMLSLAFGVKGRLQRTWKVKMLPCLDSKALLCPGVHEAFSNDQGRAHQR